MSNLQTSFGEIVSLWTYLTHLNNAVAKLLIEVHYTEKYTKIYHSVNSRENECGHLGTAEIYNITNTSRISLMPPPGTFLTLQREPRISAIAIQ
jgi:hypothetical protein